MHISLHYNIFLIPNCSYIQVDMSLQGRLRLTMWQDGSVQGSSQIGVNMSPEGDWARLLSLKVGGTLSPYEVFPPYNELTEIPPTNQMPYSVEGVWPPWVILCVSGHISK